MSLISIIISTWNIGSLHEGGHYARNLDYLRTVLTARPTDILCLQECPNDPDFLRQVTEWTGLTHIHYVVTSESHIDLQHDMGLCVLSRCPVTEISRIQPAKPQVEAWHKGKREYWHDKLFLALHGEIHGRELAVITGHGFPFHRYGLDDGEHDSVIAPSFGEVDHWIRELRSQHPHILFCIAADFNYGEPLRFMPYLNESFADAFHGEATRPSGRKTDAIILPADHRPGDKQNVRAPLNEKGRGYFDHNFISASYSL